MKGNYQLKIFLFTFAVWIGIMATCFWACGEINRPLDRHPDDYAAHTEEAGKVPAEITCSCDDGSWFRKPVFENEPESAKEPDETENHH
jgi:hypothetical protein